MSLRLASGTENLQAIAEFGRASGVDTGLFESALKTFQAATRDGHGVNLAAIFETLKQFAGLSLTIFSPHRASSSRGCPERSADHRVRCELR